MMMSGFALMIVGSLMTLLSSLLALLLGLPLLPQASLLPTRLRVVLWVLKANKPKPMRVLCIYFLLYGFKYCRFGRWLVLATRRLECDCGLNRCIVVTWDIFSGLYLSRKSKLMY